MTLLSEIGQSTFVEVIRVDPFEGLTCESKVILGNSRWQNPTNRFDVNGDGIINEFDYNTLLTWISQFGQGQLPALKPETDPWVDVNGDGAVDNADLQQLYNYLNGLYDEGDPTCHRVSDFRIERDLLDPAQIINCTTESTVRAVACHKNVIPTADYTPYFLCAGLLETTWDAVVTTKDSIIYVHNDLLVPRDPYFAGCSDTPRVLNRILKRLQTESFPQRYDPKCRLTRKVGDLSDPPDIPGEPILPHEPELTTTTTTPEPVFGLLARVVIINIFDKAERYLTVETWYANSSARVIDGPHGFEASGTHYVDDRILWEQFIDSIEDNDSVSVRAGIVHPKGTGEVWPASKNLPKDSYRTQIDYISFDLKSPRISTSNIINAFNIITQNGQFDPTLLIFVTDKAEDAQWASPIARASRQLQGEYPRMQVMKYPFSKPFHRWIMMDLDAMLQLLYQRDNVNTDLNSTYRVTGTEGIIEDAAMFQSVRQTHIEYRLVYNEATVNWYEFSLRDSVAPDPPDPFGQPRPNLGADYDLEPKGKGQACYAILNPFGWRINSEVVGTDGSAPQRVRISFTSNPFFAFQQSLLWAESIVNATREVVDVGPGLQHTLRRYVIYLHSSNEINDPPYWEKWVTAYFMGMQQNIRVGSFTASSPTSVPSELSGFVDSINVVDNYPVTHTDPVYGQLAGIGPSGGGIYVSVWYNDLHAIITEGPIRGPRGKDHYVRDKSSAREAVYEERQRAIVLYSDPDFQDKIYYTLEHYFESVSRYTYLERFPKWPFNFRSWENAGRPWFSGLSFRMECPEFPVGV